jgi:hypothetical protein
MASSTIGQHTDRSLTQGVHSLRINGLIHHRHGALTAGVNQTPAFAQVYLFDLDAARDRRVASFEHVDDREKEIIELLGQILKEAENIFITVRSDETNAIICKNPMTLVD